MQTNSAETTNHAYVIAPGLVQGKCARVFFFNWQQDIDLIKNVNKPGRDSNLETIKETDVLSKPFSPKIGENEGAKMIELWSESSILNFTEGTTLVRTNHRS